MSYSKKFAKNLCVKKICYSQIVCVFEICVCLPYEKMLAISIRIRCAPQTPHILFVSDDYGMVSSANLWLYRLFGLQL